MLQPRTFYARGMDVRRRIADYVLNEAPEGWRVRVSPEVLGDNKRARFHAVCNELARSGLPWAGRRRTLPDWKVILIGGHATLSGIDVDMIEGIEGDVINLRESMASIGAERGRSVVMYSEAFAINQGVALKEFA